MSDAGTVPLEDPNRREPPFNPGLVQEVLRQLDKTVRETLAALGIVPEVVALVVVNEEQRTKDYVIQEGDIIRVLAVIGGG